MKKLTHFLLMASLALIPTMVSAESYKLPAKSGIAFEVSTGKILYEKDAKEKLPVSSLTKVLTTYMVYKEVDAGRLSWDTPVKISDYPYSLTTDYTISNVPLDARKYTVKELLEAMLVTNANSPAIALAEKIGGTEPLFVDKMQKQLKEWRIHDAKLVNATGLSNSQLGDHIYPKSKKNAENKMSAQDLAIVTRHLLQDYPQVTKITKKPSAPYQGDRIFSYNYMLKGMPNYRIGTNGLFVSYSENGGASLISSNKENKMDIVSIILDADKADGQEFTQFTAANALLDDISKNYEAVTLVKEGATLKGKTIKVTDSPKTQVGLVADQSIRVVQKIGTAKLDKLRIQPLKSEFQAPLVKKEELASASYKDTDPVGIGYLGDKPTYQLSAKEEIPRSFFLKVWWNHFVTYVNEKL